MDRLRWRVVFAVAAIGLCEASVAQAQVLGTFRWQFAPYCNVVTVLVEQKGSVYELTGTDDNCDGAAPAASANGSAHINTGGTAGGSFALVRANGFVVNNSFALNPATLSGTWRDDWGNTGTLVFNPPSPAGGAPRPLTMRGDYSLVFTAAAIGNVEYGSVSFPQALPSAPTAPAVNVIPFGGPPTANCPGTVANPLAAPGQLCLYERVRSGLTVFVVLNVISGGANAANATGFSVAASAAVATTVGAYGRWAVGVP